MKTKIKELKECAKLLYIEVPVDIVNGKFEEVYKNIKKAASIPGFRVGQAPDDMIRSRYSEFAKEKVLEGLIPDCYTKAIEETALIPVDAPEISEVKFEKNKPLSFTAKIEVRPAVNVKKYKGLEAKKESALVGEEDVDKSLAALQEQYAEFAPAEGRAAEDNDFIIADMEISSSGKIVHKQKRAWFEIKKIEGKPAFTDNFIGMKAGEDKKFESKLGDDIGAKEYAGKEATFSVRLHEIKTKKLPALDDNFAKMLGGHNTLAELKARMQEELSKMKESDVNAKVENALIDQLIKNNSFDVPQALVKRQLERLVKDAKMKLAYQGYKEEDVTKQEKFFEEKFRPEAERLVKIYFILDNIAEHEKIDVVEKEIEEEITRIAARSQKKPDEIKDYLNKNGLMDDIRYELREKKAVKFVVDNAIIK